MAMRNFWYDVEFKRCKCGKKIVVHGHCQDCWNNGGKEKVINVAVKERDKLHDERKKAHKAYLKRIMGIYK